MLIFAFIEIWQGPILVNIEHNKLFGSLVNKDVSFYPLAVII